MDGSACTWGREAALRGVWPLGGVGWVGAWPWAEPFPFPFPSPPSQSLLAACEFDAR